MPELPEVETVRRGLAPHMEDAVIERLELRRKDLRFPFPDKFAAHVKDKTITALSRRAKYLLIGLSNGDTIIAHLGMSGSFKVMSQQDLETPGAFHHERSTLAAHDHVVFHLINQKGEKAQVIYNDPRRFGFLLMTPTHRLSEHKLLAGIGIEPLGNALSGAYLGELFEDRTTTFKAALLDQRLVAGLGNIYVCEALWRAGLSPFSPASSLKQTADLLASSIRDVLNEALEAGGSSLRDHRQTDGSLGYFQHRFAVYGREGEPCPKAGCAATIERKVQNGRSTFYCPSCQKAKGPLKARKVMA
ncbi:MAG: bifunctional DNA-formamidopyrimidine glycosylase/DNA-(apurinic or apyrimidinic site) lyase [Rhizobiaceae bacterium]